MHLFDISHVSFTYAEEREKVLNDISMTIEEGGFYILCGRSGCGKSTLLQQFKSTLTPHGTREGLVQYKGEPLERVSVRVQSEEIGFVFQNPEDQIVTEKVWHELAFGLENLGYANREIHMRTAEMASYFGMESWFDKKVSELSGGQKQMLNLASVLVLHPKLLILDEPMAQLDTLASREFFHTLLRLHREMGMTILLSEHNLEEVFAYADKIFLMENGGILAEGTPEEIGPELLREKHDLFLSMPTPFRISAWCGESKDFPYTIASGRKWLKGYLEKPGGGAKESEEAVSLELLKSSQDLSEKNAVEIKNAWFRYGKEEPYILEELSLSVRKGEIFSLLGGNGTGKSTLLRCIAGFLPLIRGKIFLHGRHVKSCGKKELFHHFLGMLPQDPSVLFLKDTVLEDLMEVTGKDEAEQMSERLGFSALLGRHPYDLSGGERQKAALAKVLLLQPEILLLDEPTKSMDAYYKKEFGNFLRALKAEGKTILMVSHDIEFCAEYTDRAGLYFRGQVEAVSDRKTFFANHHFYTTAASRMAGEFFPEAVTAEEAAAKIASAADGTLH